jgi:hypothetical protein
MWCKVVNVMRKNALKIFIGTALLLSTMILVTNPLAIAPKTNPVSAEALEHDLEVFLFAPNDILLGNPVQLKTNVTNVGSSNETNVKLSLLINGTTVANKTMNLSVGSNGTLSYTWTPKLALSQVELPTTINKASYTYNITAYASPVQGETSIDNNMATKMARVWNPVVYVEYPPPKNVNDTFTVSVRVANLTDKTIPHPDPYRAAIGSIAPCGNLYALDIRFAWDPKILQYVSHVIAIPVEDYPGGVLHEPILNLNISEVDPTAGTCHFANASITPAAAFNNPGFSSTIFNMTFKVLANGGCLLRINSSDLSAKSQSGVSTVIFHARVDGIFETLGAPKAIFTFWPSDAAVVNKAVTFNASASYDPDGYITRYAWDFGDGTKENSTSPIINHTYTTDGLYEVKLVVFDNETVPAPSAPAIKSLRVVKLRNIVLKSITVSTKTIYQGLTVKINVTVKNEGDVAETFDVSVYYNKTVVDTGTQWELVDTKGGVNLGSLNSTDPPLMFSWNTSGVAQANYYILANATIVPHEGNITDNAKRFPESIYVTTELIHDVAIKSINAKVSVGTKEFDVPAILGEDVTAHVEVIANGTVPETFNTSLHVVAPNGTVIFTKTWENTELDTGYTKAFSYAFSTTGLTKGNYTISVNVTIAEVDARLGNNYKPYIFKVIDVPVIVVEDLPSHIYLEDTVTFNATATQCSDGHVTSYLWTFYQTGLLRMTKSGAVVNATFDATGDWSVTLEITDSNMIYYQISRPKTQAYQKVLSFTVEGRPSAFPVEAIYIIVGVVVVAVVGVLAYLRLRKPKSEPK